MGWVSAKVFQYVEMVRLWNHLISLPDHRTTKKIFIWDISIYVIKIGHTIYLKFLQCVIL